MLQEIRERAQGWFAWLIVAMISIPFALWGIQEYLGGGGEAIVATVNGGKITERDFDYRYRQFRERMREQMGKAYRPEMMDEKVLRQEVLESMIRAQLVSQTSDDLGLYVGDTALRETIATIPAFQVGGQFNRDAYERAVQSQGLSTRGFEDEMRQMMVSNQFSQAVSGSEWVSDGELAEFTRLRDQQREFDYLILPVADFLSQVELAEGEAKGYYEKNPAEFKSPERVKVQYLELNGASIASGLTADDDALQGYYDQHKDDYQTAERRRASHILIQVADAAADEAAKARAQAALDRVKAGENFAEVAKQLSEDPGSAPQGGDLGFFEKGVMDPAFEEYVFGAQPGAFSDPVRSQFGYHVILLHEIQPPAGKSFAEAKELVRAAYLKGESERLFYEYAEKLGALAYENPDNLQPAADALKLEVKQSEWITRQGGAAPLDSPKVANAAFSEDVRVEGRNSEPIEVGGEHVVVVRVTDHEDESTKPFEQVQEEIVKKLKEQRAAEKAQARGEELFGKLKAGATLEQLAAETGKERKQSGSVGRAQSAVAPEIAKSAFRLSRPQGDAPVYGNARLGGGDYVLIALRKVTDGTADLPAERKEQMSRALERAQGQGYYQDIVQTLRDRADVKIRKTAQQGSE